MKNILTIEFNTLEDSLENIVKISTKLISNYITNFERIDFVPTLEKNYKIYLDKHLVLSKENSTKIDIDVLGKLVEEKLKAKGIDCFGWECSDVLRKTN